MRRVIDASILENEAIDLDRAGQVHAALKKYEECESMLASAIAVALPAYKEDHPKLVQHRKEVLDRVEHLKGLKGDVPTIPVEQQIKAVQLGMQATSAASSAMSSAGGMKTLAACAALGAVGGFLVLGGTLGATISLVGGAASAAYCATRGDKVGEITRGAGAAAIAGADKAVELNREHKVTEKLADAGTKAIEVAKQVNDKYKISDKVADGVSKAITKAKEIEEKHHVTDKVAAGLSAGLAKLSSALEGAKRGSASDAPSGAPA